MLCSIISTIVVPVATGFVATLLFTIGFYRGLRPRISISDNISLGNDGRLYIKIANKRRFVGLYNIKVHAYLCGCLSVESGKDKIVTPLKNDFEDMKVNLLQPRTERYKYASHATVSLIVPDERIAQLIINGRLELVVQVVAVQGWSNVSGIYAKEYKLPFAIKNHPFKEGSDTNIDYQSLERGLNLYIEEKGKIVSFKRTKQ